MKRLALISAAACLGLAGVGIAAARDGGPADGTLVVKNGIGSVQFNGRGSALGHIGSGFVQIKDPVANDGIEPIVNGAELAYDINAKTTRYAGTDIRFRMLGGRFIITVVGADIDLSIVGKGEVRIDGRGMDDDGTYSVNGAPPEAIPFLPIRFSLAVTSPTPGGGQNGG